MRYGAREHNEKKKSRCCCLRLSRDKIDKCSRYRKECYRELTLLVRLSGMPPRWQSLCRFGPVYLAAISQSIQLESSRVDSVWVGG